MSGFYKNIKSKLNLIIGGLIILLVLLIIIQYNNYYNSKKTLETIRQVNNTLILPEQLTNLQNRFINSDILNEKIVSGNQSFSLDSVNILLSQYSAVIDSLMNSDYVSLNKKTRIKLIEIVETCNILKGKNLRLKDAIIERGLYITGKSGEWHRFGNYLHELSFESHNPELIREITELTREQLAYQLDKSSQDFSVILEHINSLKISLNLRKPSVIKGIDEPYRIKFLSELESFAILTQSLQKFDTNLGLCGSEGMLGEVNSLLARLSNKSKEAYVLINKNISHAYLISFLSDLSVIILLLAFYFLFFYRFSRVIIITVQRLKDFTSDLLKGKLPPPIKLTGSSELAEIGSLLNNYTVSLNEKIKFASNIGTGNQEVNMVPLSEDDTLANALLNMEKSLNKAAEEDKKYKIEEQKRAWSNEGLAKFSEILRMQTNDLSTLSDEIISNLVRYVAANQGGIFLYNDEVHNDVHLELMSAFAFDRKKYLKKRIEIGEGLTGTCALEKQTIFLTDIPDNYIEITSGLGDAPPRSILIVPMKTEEAIFGIIELASFNVFKAHEIEFVEKIAQSTASTFATVKININTTRLLEQSKKQAEEMVQQEEELRQNLEELQSTQEESARREAEFNSLIHAVDISSLVIQCDIDGRIIEINKKFAVMLKLSRDELINRTLKTIFSFNNENEEFYNLLKSLKQGKSVVRHEEVNLTGGTTDFYLVHYSPILDNEGRPYKILGIGSNITETINLEQSLKKSESSLANLEYNYEQYKSIVVNGFINCELNPEGDILEANANYTDTTGYSHNELIGKNYRTFLKPDEIKQFELIWTEIHKDKTYNGVIKRTKPTGDQIWLMVSFVPIKDNKGVIKKIQFFGMDITEKKLKYQILEDANDEIERLKNMLGNQPDKF